MVEKQTEKNIAGLTEIEDKGNTSTEATHKVRNSKGQNIHGLK